MKYVWKLLAAMLTLIMISSAAFAQEEIPTVIDSQSSVAEVSEPADSSSSEESSSEELTGEKEGNSSPEDSGSMDNSDSESSDTTDEDTSSGEQNKENAPSDDTSTGKDETNSDSGEDSTDQDSSSEDEPEKEEEKDEVTKKPAKKKSGISYANVRTKATYEGTAVNVEELGTIYTLIKVNGESTTVLTQELDFADVDEAHLQLAYIIAPKTGRAAMRDKPAKAETIIRYCDAGDLLIVLSSDEEYTHVLYKGTKGYVLNNTIQLIDIPETNGEYAQLSKEGRTESSAIINIRNQADRNSCKIVEWRTGTEVTVWDLVDGWYEIEAHGMRGFVMEEFVTIDPGV